jgi:peroxiredoxin
MNPAFQERRRLTLAALATATLGLGGLSGCSSRDPAPSSRFLLLDGSTLESSALAGKVTLVNFWATTCTSCVAEMPELIRTHQKYQARGFETVAVAMSYDPVEWVLNFTRSRQLPFKVALDRDGQLAKSWGEVKLTPTTFVVDRQGQIVKRYVGPPDFAALHQLIEQLLASA